MKIDLTKVSYEGKVFDFGKAKLTIRPYPQSRADIAFNKNGERVFSGANARDMFTYCLTDWDNVFGADDQPLKLTEDIKNKIYDFKLSTVKNEKGEDVSMSDFVINTARELTEGIAADTKN
jgi:hypothetical protein